MKIIKLTKGLKVKVDDSDFEWLSHWSWYASGGKYAARRMRKAEDESKPLLYMHRAITGAPLGMQVDHKNGDTLDNRRANLRICTASQNCGNSRPIRGYRYKGIAYLRTARNTSRGYHARIKVHRQVILLGCFFTEYEAALAYDAAAVKYFGEFARLNFPNGGKNKP